MLKPDEKWSVFEGDCIPHMAEVMEPASIDLMVTSCPFPALYAYSSDPSDMGNTDTMGSEARVHFKFFYHALVRVLKPGRVACVHVCQIPRMKKTGEVGLCDFRGINIRTAERAGLIYEYDWCIRKNPQAQALRTRSRELQFAGLEADRAKSRGALADYVIKFRAPGVNAVPVVGKGQVSRNQWIDWAEAAWTDIRETDTLNFREAKGEEDTRHICPLQLPLIDRLVKLFTNPGELVFDPFNGIASTGHIALTLGRRYYGCELKPEYVKASRVNLRKAERSVKTFKANQLFESSSIFDEDAVESSETGIVGHTDAIAFAEGSE